MGHSPLFRVFGSLWAAGVQCWLPLVGMISVTKGYGVQDCMNYTLGADSQGSELQPYHFPGTWGLGQLSNHHRVSAVC